MSLFRLAWSSKIRLPLLITVAFLALDVNLQVEINVFWAPVDRDGDGQGPEDPERPRQRRRHNGNGPPERQTARGLFLPAPLAQMEDFENPSSGEEERSESDLDSSGSSTYTGSASSSAFPSDYDIPNLSLPRYRRGLVPNSHMEEQQELTTRSEETPRSRLN